MAEAQKNVVIELPSRRPVRDDRALVEAIVRGDREAIGELYDRHVEHLRRVVGRILGPNHELNDVLQDVFTQAIDGIHRLEDPDRLEAWLTRIAVNNARTWIRRRQRRRWLSFLDPDDLPEPLEPAPDDDDRDAARRTYAVLARLPDDERIPFALRYLAEMELTEVAGACNVSLATIKRRLRDARRRFDTIALRDPVLREYLKEGSR